MTNPVSQTSLPKLNVDYTNHRGERRRRNLIPLTLEFGSTNWHPQPQYFLVCVDTEKTTGEARHYPLSGFHMETLITERT